LLGPWQPAPAPLGAQLVHGFVRWLDAECSAQPVLLIVENGHLADARAVSLLDAAMRELPDRPLMILVLTRPDVSERFPQLWFEYRSAVVPLASLPRSVCERLVRRVLGPEVANATVERLVGRAHGNPLHLEELLRAALAGNHDSLPETLLALVQVQLLGLPPLTRRILRAASLFGLDFSVRGVLELLGNTPPVSAEEVEQSLQLLIEAQLIAPQRESRLAVGVEYRFRQPLIQEAVYSLLTPAARMLGHRLAHAFLTAAGESDQSVLDEHARRGRERTSPS
jgi:predicted ATPase